MKRIEVQLTDENIHGLFAISLVDKPAIESNWVCLRSQAEGQPIHLAVEQMKQTITGPVLIPDKPIYRQTESGEEFEILFTSQVIEQLRNKFMKEKRTDQVTEMHQGGTVGVYMTEVWTITDPEKDKAAALGLTLPAGTLMASMKIDNPDVWELVKAGEYKGFSIEAYLNLDKVMASKQMTKEELIEELLNEIVEELVK